MHGRFCDGAGHSAVRVDFGAFTYRSGYSLVRQFGITIGLRKLARHLPAWGQSLVRTGINASP